MFCQMIAQLAELSEIALPTSFHHLLRALDERRRLLRVYTQNIDALEQKCGLTFGVPETDAKRNKPRLCKPKADVPEAGPSTVVHHPQSRLPTPPMETPRCIPLHGTLQQMHCQICTHSFPLRDYLPALVEGKPPYCPECNALEKTRQLVGKRSRGVGKLRPSVVLYNEMHKDGEEVGDVVRRDLIGSSKGKGRAGADLLLVVGTSLRVPGTKRIVREFSKAVHSRDSVANEGTTSVMGLSTPTPSPRRSPADDEEPPIRAVYLNLDFPVPTREWDGVFDVWVRGDAQEFARLVLEEMNRELRAKEEAAERKRRREEAALAAKLEEHMNVSGERPNSGSGSTKKRKPAGDGQPGSTKKQRVAPPTPVSMKKPPAKARKPKSSRGVSLPAPTKDNGQSVKPKSGLTIRIPPRPVVLITTPPPKPKVSGMVTPLPSPPSSPLTPMSSPASRRRSMSSPLSLLSPSPQPRSKYAYGFDSGHSEELSEFSDDDFAESELTLPTFRRRSSFEPAG